MARGLDRNRITSVDGNATVEIARVVDRAKQGLADTLDLSLDLRALAFVAALAVGTTLLIAAVAAIFGFRADVADSLRARSARCRA